MIVGKKITGNNPGSKLLPVGVLSVNNQIVVSVARFVFIPIGSFGTDGVDPGVKM